MGRTACAEPQCVYKGALYQTLPYYLVYKLQKVQIVKKDVNCIREGEVLGGVFSIHLVVRVNEPGDGKNQLGRPQPRRGCYIKLYLQ